jgi:LysR family glycine cleavage system transcriptional activator
VDKLAGGQAGNWTGWQLDRLALSGNYPDIAPKEAAKTLQKRHLPPLNALRTFEAAARHLHMGKAADELGVTHGAVSKQIVNLEDQLGFSLFQRLGNRLALTDQGAKLLKAATTAFDQLGYAIARLDGEAIAGELRVSVPSAFAEKWLVPRLARFIDLVPGLKLAVHSATASYEAKADDILGENLDLAVRYGEPVWKDGTARLLSHVGSFPVCSPVLMSADPGLASPADLRHHTLLLDDPDGANWRRWLDRAGVPQGEMPRTIYFQDFNLLLAAARQGLGLCLADQITAGEDLARGHLLRPFRQSIEHLGAYFIVLPALVSPGAQAFAEWLEAEIALSGMPADEAVS